MIFSVLIYILQGVLIKKSDFTPAFEGILSICTWLFEEIKAQLFLQKKAVPSCLVILGFTVTPSQKKKKEKEKRKRKKKSNHSIIK